MKIRPIFEVETIDDMQYMVCLDSSVLSGTGVHHNLR